MQLKLMDSLYKEAMQNIHPLLFMPCHQPFDPFLSLLLAFALLGLWGLHTAQACTPQANLELV